MRDRSEPLKLPLLMCTLCEMLVSRCVRSMAGRDLRFFVTQGLLYLARRVEDLHCDSRVTASSAFLRKHAQRRDTMVPPADNYYGVPEIGPLIRGKCHLLTRRPGRGRFGPRPALSRRAVQATRHNSSIAWCSCAWSPQAMAPVYLPP